MRRALRSGPAHLPAALFALSLVVAGCGTTDHPPATDVPVAATDAPVAMDSGAVVDRPAITDVGVAIGAGPSPPLTVGPQTPPSSGRVDLEVWLTAGHYRSWHCEPAPHASRSPSPHGVNRICSNDLLSGSSGDGP